MPQPGSKKYDTKRARLRKEAERSGVSGQDANEAANDSLQQDARWRSQGPRTERGRGPKGERPENADRSHRSHPPERGRPARGPAQPCTGGAVDWR
ncbi:hypothetical protein JIX56_07475 [Streptomyces sp. CA-210063]|uniref:hypothetical protein n=1 Tax=Streptomyces sp. CA-210063 TaxID=2801029 RepID=UPI00214D1144|nr:hypothetical protein [Streptomyces sp. CA-210063]UUU29739.1 hypothetical protein JIX56_07475 [Streptomyces sp. CA-210063]